MKRIFQSQVVSTGLAIFSMFFGAGNLMYPILVGITSGKYNLIGMGGFFLTAICLPLAGLVGMILFDGDYDAFFGRLGKHVGAFFVFTCMIIIGPLIAIPRIVTLSHTMIGPFLPIPLLQNTNSLISSLIFALIFLGITFLITFRENKIVQILGTVISPLLLISLVIIIVKGILTGTTSVEPHNTGISLFFQSLMRGYETLDLLGAIFFASIVLTILKNTLGPQYEKHQHQRAIFGLKAGTLGLSLLAVVYFGMSYLGVFHGHGLQGINAGELFSAISFTVLGNYGAVIIAIAVLMACLSTSIALSAVVGEYFEKDLFKGRVPFVVALIFVLLLCLPLSTFGLGKVLQLTGGEITFIGYPVLIVLTLCNIAYKLFGFKPIKIPVAVTFVFATIIYYYPQLIGF